MGLPSISLRTERTSRLVAFASGKGGVGKTVCTANLALHLAQRHRVLTVDLDLGCGNLNASLGIRAVSNSINDFIAARVPNFFPLKTPTAAPGLELISCSYSPVGSTVLTSLQKERLIDHMRSDRADFVFMDLAAGVNDDVLDLFAAADVRVLVTGPESLALHNAFVFVKSLVYRIITKNLEHAGLPKRTRENIVRQLYDSGDMEISKTIERIRTRNSATANAIQTILAGVQLQLIMNKVQDPAEERFVTNLQQLIRKYVDVELNYLGSIPYDDNIKKSLNEIVPFALEYEVSPANGAFRAAAHRLDQALSETSSADRGLFEGTQPSSIRRFATLIEDTWSGAVAPFQSEPVPARADYDEYELKISKLSEELSEAKRTHGKEKVNWHQEKEIIITKSEELLYSQDILQTRQKEAGKLLEDAVRQREESIAILQSAARKELLLTRHSLAEKDTLIASLERELHDCEERIGASQTESASQTSDLRQG